MHLNTHCAQFCAQYFPTQSLENELQNGRQVIINLTMTLQDDNLEELGCMRLGFVVVDLSRQDLFDHLEDAFEPLVRIGEKRSGVDRDIVVQDGHELGEIVGGIVLEDVMNEKENGPHLVRYLLSSERAQYGEQLLIVIDHSALNY